MATAPKNVPLWEAGAVMQDPPETNPGATVSAVCRLGRGDPREIRPWSPLSAPRLPVPPEQPRRAGRVSSWSATCPGE